MTAKLEFASRAWLEALEELLRIYAAAAGPELQLTMCEVFTGVPHHLDADGDGVIAWHCRIGEGRVDFAEGETSEVCDFKTIVDYQAVLPIARWVVTAENRPQYDAMVAKATAEGKMRQVANTGKIPASFYNMHNDLAVRTL